MKVEIGDMVMIVRRHCNAPVGRSVMFMPFIVREILTAEGPADCDACHQAVDICGQRVVKVPSEPGHVPESWLQVIRPPGKKEERPREEELTA